MNNLPVVRLKKYVTKTIAMTTKSSTTLSSEVPQTTTTAVLRTIRLEGLQPMIPNSFPKPTLEIVGEQPAPTSKETVPVLTDSDQENNPLPFTTLPSKDSAQTSKSVAVPLESPPEDFARWPGSCESSSPIASPNETDLRDTVVEREIELGGTEKEPEKSPSPQNILDPAFIEQLNNEISSLNKEAEQPMGKTGFVFLFVNLAQCVE